MSASKDILLTPALMVPCMIGSSQREYGEPPAMSSVARRVEMKLWLAHPSKLDFTLLPFTTIHLSAMAPNWRGVPKLRGVGLSEDSHDSFEEMTCRTRPPMSELDDVTVLDAAGGCGAFETIESSRFGYLS